MKSPYKILFAFSFFLLILWGGNTSYAADPLEIHVKKNSQSGDEWTSVIYPIKVTVTGVSGPVGIGQTFGSVLSLNPAMGPLELAPESPLVCTFNVDAGTNPPSTVEVVEKINVYKQRPSGDFIIPPLRIRDERILMSGSSYYSTLADTSTVCGGDNDAHVAFLQELTTLPENPFRTYREFIYFPESPGTVHVSIVGLPDPLYPDVVPINPDPLGNDILGYACEVPVYDTDGTTVLSKDKGICESDGSTGKIDLIVIARQRQPVIRANIQDPLVQGHNAEISALVTVAGNFAIRTTALLDWALAIDDTGFRNENITMIYNKSLNIANGFFILALLAIAFLWNFSIIISRDRLKRMVILFVIGAVSVNFSLPLTRLLVDGTNILQRTLLVKSASGEFSNNAIEFYDGRLADLDPTDADDQAKIEKIEAQMAAMRADLRTSRISASDILSAYDIDYGGFVGLQRTLYLSKNYPQNLGETVDTEQLTEKDDLYVDRFKEPTFFNVLLVVIGSIGQLLIALIFVFRYVILWFLLIFSPFLLVLSLFHTTRFLFRYWVWLFGRWLLIGPILAMTLYIIVNIWTLTGVPLESSYNAPSTLIYPNTTNLYVAAPGVTSGYLNTPREIMKYISALMMLYMGVILPFWLTRYIRGDYPILSPKMPVKRRGFFTPKGPSEALGEQEPVHVDATVYPEVKQMTQMPVEILPQENTATEKEYASEATSEAVATHDKSTSSVSSKDKVSTKELLNTLSILTASQQTSSNTSISTSRLESQKEAITKELHERSKKGDAIAQKALEKAESHTTRDAHSLIQESKSRAASRDDKVTTSAFQTQKGKLHEPAETKESIHERIKESTAKHEKISEISSAHEAHKEIDVQSLIKDSEDKKKITDDISKKKFETEKERLTQKSEIAEDVGQKIREETLRKMNSDVTKSVPESGEDAGAPKKEALKTMEAGKGEGADDDDSLYVERKAKTTKKHSYEDDVDLDFDDVTDERRMNNPLADDNVEDKTDKEDRESHIREIDREDDASFGSSSTPLQGADRYSSAGSSETGQSGKEKIEVEEAVESVIGMDEEERERRDNKIRGAGAAEDTGSFDSSIRSEKTSEEARRSENALQREKTRSEQSDELESRNTEVYEAGESVGSPMAESSEEDSQFHSERKLMMSTDETTDESFNTAATGKTEIRATEESVGSTVTESSEEDSQFLSESKKMMTTDETTDEEFDSLGEVSILDALDSLDEKKKGSSTPGDDDEEESELEKLLKGGIEDEDVDTDKKKKDKKKKKSSLEASDEDEEKDEEK